MSNVDLYLVSQCPKCNSKNWMYYGDPNDSSYFTAEGLRCWNCRCCWLLEDEEEFVNPEEDECFEDGKRFEEVK
jgi:hypothetical protein